MNNETQLQILYIIIRTRALALLFSDVTCPDKVGLPVTSILDKNPCFIPETLYKDAVDVSTSSCNKK